MGDGPVAKVPIVSRTGDVNADITAIGVQLKQYDKLLTKMLRDGKPLDKDIQARYKAAQELQRQLQTVKLQDARIEGADRAAKVAKFLAGSQAIKNIVTGNASFTDLTTVFSSHRVEELLVKSFSKLGLAGFGASLARTLPIAGIVADVAEAGFNYLIQKEKDRGEAEKAFSKTFDVARAANLSPEIAKQLRETVTTERLFGSGVNLNDPGTRKRLESLFPDVDFSDPKARAKFAENYKSADINDPQVRKEMAADFFYRLKQIQEAKPFFNEIVGRSMAQVLKDRQQKAEELSQEQIEEIQTGLLRLVESPDGYAKFAKAKREKEETQAIRAETERRKTAVQKYQDGIKKKREEFVADSRDKRFSATAAYGDLITHIAD